MPGWGHDHVATGVFFTACQKHIVHHREECNCIVLKLGYIPVREKKYTCTTAISVLNNSWFTKENCEVKLKKMKCLSQCCSYRTQQSSSAFSEVWKIVYCNRWLNNPWLLVLIAGCIYFLISAFEERLTLFRLRERERENFLIFN